MSNEVRPIKMRTANNRPQPMKNEFIHYGTTDFFKPQVIHCQAVNPGETVNISSVINIKGKPLMMPGEHQIKHIVSAFWVPNFATHKDWFSFRTNLPFKMDNTYAKHEDDYYLYNTTLVYKFLEWHDALLKTFDYLDKDNWEWYYQQIVKPQVGIKYDVHLTMFERAQDETISCKGTLCFNLTNKGRMMLNLLQQLGYNINWQICFDTQEGVVWNPSDQSFEEPIDFLMQFNSASEQGSKEPMQNPNEVQLSARPIIGFIKIMIDYYVPPQYTNYFTETLENILEHSQMSSSTGLGYLLTKLCNWINYDIDRFTGAWKNPQGPNDSESKIYIEDITADEGDRVGGAYNYRPLGNGTPIATTSETSAGSNYITDFLLRSLDALQNFTTRNRIAGYRPIDRFLAHFGKRLDYIHTKRSQYIDGNTNNLAIIDVTAMAETSDAVAGKTGMYDSQLLGGQAAKVQGQNGISFKWTADDDGWIFIIDTIVPRSGYFQGIKNHCLRVNWLDHYNPEFDNLGTQPIRRSEIFHSAEGLGELFNDEQIWGYEPTYMGMKVGWDTKSGDRRIRTLNTGLEAMDTLRTFDVDGSNVPESVGSNFLKGEQAQYDRIFQYIKDDVDHYYFIAKTVDNGKKPMKSISESLPLTDGEGNTIEMQYGGGNYLQ